jgi:hypothetical protein
MPIIARTCVRACGRYLSGNQLTGGIPSELGELASFPHALNPTFWFNFLVSALMGPVITYSSILCTTYNSPLATTITGNVKGLFITILGAAIFPGFKATVSSVSGIGIALVGAAGYSYVSLRESRATRAAHVAAVAASKEPGAIEEVDSDADAVGGAGAHAALLIVAHATAAVKPLLPPGHVTRDVAKS